MHSPLLSLGGTQKIRGGGRGGAGGGWKAGHTQAHYVRQKAALPTLARRGRQPHTFGPSAWPLPPQVSVLSVCTWGSLNPCSVRGLITGAQVGERPGMAEKSCAMQLLPGPLTWPPVRARPRDLAEEATTGQIPSARVSALGHSPSTAHLEGLPVVRRTTDHSLVTPPASPGTERLTQPSGQTRPSKPILQGRRVGLGGVPSKGKQLVSKEAGPRTWVCGETSVHPEN